jgi:hypothetical protein
MKINGIKQKIQLHTAIAIWFFYRRAKNIHWRKDSLLLPLLPALDLSWYFLFAI